MDNAGAVLGSASSLLILWGFLGYALWNVKTELPTVEEMSALRWLFGLAIVPGLFATWALLAKVREITPSRTEKPIGGEARQSRLPRRFYAFLGVVTLFTLGNSSDLFLLFYGKTRFQLSLLMMVLVWVVLHISKVMFSVPGGMLSDRLGRRAVIVAGWVVYTAVYIGMAVVRREWTFWALIIVYGAYYGLTEGAEKALVADYVKSEQRGRAYGLYHGAVGVAALPASLVFGVFWAKLGPAIAFAIGASLAGLAAVLLMLLLATRKAGGEPGPALLEG
jgi:MFS-type transporter involved in bile tolerance (Atg22 family)